MPTYKEILQQENLKPRGTLLLFEEGIFMKAYEKSAYHLSCRYGFKTNKKYVKILNGEVVSVGFPVKNLAKYFPEAKIDNGMAIVPIEEEIKEHDFLEWKNGLEVKTGQISQQEEPVLSEKPASYIENDSESKKIVLSIMAFPIETASPVDCMMFLIELKKKINAIKL